MPNERSAFMGPRLRRLRRRLGLTQAVMAEELDISPSYIALIERNHRPMSADLLIRLAETYDLDIADFAAAEDETTAQLNAALADPVFFRPFDWPGRYPRPYGREPGAERSRCGIVPKLSRQPERSDGSAGQRR